jgi:hypothetical protein
MKSLSRRSVAGGLAAAVTAIPALGHCAARKSDPMDRIKHLTAELAKAMREQYGVEVEVLAFCEKSHEVPCVLIAANGRGRGTGL